MKNKAQSMSTNTIVILILAVAVLVVLILGFTMGWNKIAPWISGSNVDNIVSTCDSAGSTNSNYDFCSVPRELKDVDKTKIKTSCAVFASVQEFAKYGITNVGVDCKLNCADIMINNNVGSKDLKQGYDVSVLAKDLVSGETCFVAK